MKISDFPLVFPNWRVPKHVVAYSTTREGGVSDGAFSSLNIGYHVGDEARRVEENRSRLPYSKYLHWMDQVHGNNVINLALNQSKRMVCDGLYSHQANYFCAVMTADCLPILLTNKLGDQVAAIHAGWKGLKTQVIKNAVAQFTCPKTEMVAWIGPCISEPCYEVDEVIFEQFSEYEQAFSIKPNGRYTFNLVSVAERQLQTLGIGSIVKSDLCTYSNEHVFFSHRRSTHKGEKCCGRQVSVIGIVGS